MLKSKEGKERRNTKKVTGKNFKEKRAVKAFIKAGKIISGIT